VDFPAARGIYSCCRRLAGLNERYLRHSDHRFRPRLTEFATSRAN
jgi:hypothetical protein